MPLDRKNLNKRKKTKAFNQLKNVVRAAKVGGVKGAKAKKQGAGARQR
jgi:hypothetical protein